MTLDVTDRFGRKPIYNEAGEIAMRYLREQRILIECGNQKELGQYVFHMRHGISMSYVPERHVGCCLAVVGGCCGQAKPGVIVFASEADIRIWEGRAER